MFKVLTLIVSLILLTNCSGPNIKFGRGIASDGTIQRSAYDLWTDLQMSGLDFVARPITVDGVENVPGTNAGVTFGAEKEASSSLLTRVMSPSDESFTQVLNAQGEENAITFKRDFLKNWTKNRNGYRTFKNVDGHVVDLATDVVDIEGTAKQIDLTVFSGVDFDSISDEQVKELFAKWMEMTEGRPFSFIKPTVRRKIFLGNMPGMSRDKIAGFKYYSDNYWKPIFGAPEKYVGSVHGHGGGQHGGWEINFKPMDTYGEFEGLISWFKHSLETNDRNGVKLFEAPGHQRMVFSKHPNLNEKKLAEVFKLIQALIVVDGVKGGTGIEAASYKSVHTDTTVNSLSSYRGAIRLEGSRNFGGNQSWAHTYSVEFRAGTKDPAVQQFIEMVLASRVGANDFSGIANSQDWTLVEGLDLRYGSMDSEVKRYANRFKMKRETVRKALKVIRASGIDGNYIVPLWHWSNPKSPMIGPTKRKLVKDMTKDFLEQLAKVDPEDSDMAKEVVRKKMKYWLRGANLSMDIRKYLLPKKIVKAADKLDQFPIREGALVDVNKIDVGIEYSGKFPIKTMAFSHPTTMDTDFRLPNGKSPWVATTVDLTDKERKKIVERIAKDLRQNLGGGSDIVADNSDGHGHGIDVAYEFKDKKNNKWRVEWDGISRNYTSSGDLIEGSARGGSIELVTPKFSPKFKEVKAVFEAFSKNNITPYLRTGGGHINIDLAPFEGKPRAMARFLATFLEYRGIISLMYQHGSRLKAGEPIKISPVLVEKLKNFNGTEEELKRLMYDERYFNTRLGRKTRYTQLDLSAYFQDVIPEEFITDDYDIINAQEAWRKQFRVEPKIRKAEFRLFDAPTDVADSLLQLKLVRAILNKALNEDDQLSGTVQKVSHEAYLANMDKAERDFMKMCTDLGLDPDEYRPALAKGLAETKSMMQSRFYTSLDEKLRPFPHVDGWGESVEPRDAEHAIGSEGRVWNPDSPEQQRMRNGGQHIPEAVQSAEVNERVRAQGLEQGIPRDRFYRESCVTNATRFFRN